MEEEVEVVAQSAVDSKVELATSIYNSWRNAHLNEIPVAFFSRLDAASPFLIAEIAAHL